MLSLALNVSDATVVHSTNSSASRHSPATANDTRARTSSASIVSDAPILIGIVCGEASGDLLAAGLMRALQQRLPNAEFVGIGGPEMIALGFRSLVDMERLSVMGLVEPLKRLPELLGIRRRLKQFFIAERPAVVIGVDSPDFNLSLERSVKRAGIPVCHYVCPSVWAWREGRVKKIRKSVDHVLALLPFEVAFLQGHDIDATFVGHPFAERLARQTQEQADRAYRLAREELYGEQPPAQLLCVMPGSRSSEVNALSEIFFDTLLLLAGQMPDLQFIIPAATPKLYRQLEQRLQQPSLQVLREKTLLLQGQSHRAITVADVVLLASGTATLEAALLAKPMVVAYNLAKLTFAIAARMVSVKHVALPNLLTPTPLVPEFLQDQASPENLSKAVMQYFKNEPSRTECIEAFMALRETLAQDADTRAAEVVLDLIQQAGSGN